MIIKNNIIAFVKMKRTKSLYLIPCKIFFCLDIQLFFVPPLELVFYHLHIFYLLISPLVIFFQFIDTSDITQNTLIAFK